MGRGLLFVVSGPSGAGKGTICQRIIRELDIDLSVSMTTRSPRTGETHGVSYYFVTRQEFEQRIEQGGFLEYAQVYDNFYGTPKEMVMERLVAGRDVILEIDPQGAMKIKESYPDGIFIFILPPSMKELRRRLTGRRTESADAVNRRLRETLTEISYIEKYDYCVVNDDLEEAVERTASIMRAEHSRVSRGVQDLIARYKEEV